MKNSKVIKIHYQEHDSYSDALEFDNGVKLYSFHEKVCCEDHYLNLKDLTLNEFKGLEFDLSNDTFFDRIDGYGVALNPVNGFPIRIPGYGINNGYYSSNLNLILTNDGVFKKIYDISKCQNYEEL